jgi:predicted nucleic acid-binding protein
VPTWLTTYSILVFGIDTTFLVQVELKEAPGHAAAKAWLDEQVSGAGRGFALAPQVVTEFIHVVTDPRRFSHPLGMDEALERAQLWWDAVEVKSVFPDQQSVNLSMRWLREHRLGRKRLLDTDLAATYHLNKVDTLLTLNRADFEIFGVFRFADY